MANSRLKMASGSLAAVLIAACATGDPGLAPADACELFIDTYCSKSASCVAASEAANSLESCEFANRLEVDCSKITHVNAQYDLCLDAMHATTCSGYTSERGLPLPEKCRGILLHDR